MKSTGNLTLEYHLDELSLLGTFQLMENLNEEVILGTPFLHQEQAVMDYGRKCLYIGTSHRKTIFWDQSQQQNYTSINNHNKIQIPEQHEQSIRPIIREYQDLFDEVPSKATTDTVVHRIRLTQDKIIHQKPYPMSPDKKKILNEQIAEMLEAGIIEPSHSPFSSPPVLVERSGKKPRFCVDFRKLNEITEDESSILPKIHETIKDFGKAKLFTLLDLKAGYWQIPMEHSSKHYTAFTTPDGASYHFTVMPFGLKTAPATFQKLMVREVLTGFLHDFVNVYLDDIIIFSNTIEEHKNHLRRVFERIRTHNLHISPDKCIIAVEELDYLGHHIKKDTTEPQQKHIKTILDFTPPQTKKQLQAFLGTCNWVREYIKDAAHLTQPLTKLLSKDVKFKWTTECQEAFEKLKTAITQEPLILHRPDFEKHFYLQTDASLRGLGATLFQRDSQGKRLVVSYASSTLTKTEMKYHVNELEVLATIWAIKKYKMYLQDKPFTLRTDSKALSWLNKNRDSKSKLMRWSLLLQEYSFTVEHCPGKDNELPDFLSRNPNPSNQREEIDEGPLSPPPFLHEEVNPLYAADHFVLYENILRTQARSRRTQQDIARWQAINTYGPRGYKENIFHKNHTVIDGVLWRKYHGRELAIIPRSTIQQVIHHYHDTIDAAHPGRDETLRAVLQNYYCPNIHQHVAEYVKNCLICSTVKSRHQQTAAPMKAHTPEYPFQTLSIDAMGPYPETARKNKYILIVTDIFSKWTEARACAEVKGKDIVQFLEDEIISRYGTPKTIISDNGSPFQGAVFNNFCERQHIEQYFSPVYHQQANPVERRVQELKKTLRTFMIGKPENTWDKFLPKALYVLRTRRNAATGMTPSKAVLGYELPKQGEWQLPQYQRSRLAPQPRRRARVRQIFARQLQFQQRYTQPDVVPDVTFSVGERVMVKVMRKNKKIFRPTWTGPHQIVRKLSDEVYEVDRGDFLSLVHVDNLRPAPAGNEPIQIETESEGEQSDDTNPASSESSSAEDEPQEMEAEPRVIEPPGAQQPDEQPRSR